MAKSDEVFFTLVACSRLGPAEGNQLGGLAHPANPHPKINGNKPT